jgi:hypothetical protein
MTYTKKLLLATLIAVAPLIGYADEQISRTEATIATSGQESAGIFFSESADEQKVLLAAWKECVQDARDNTPAKLKSALTYQEIRDLLRAEEEACFFAIKNEFKVSDALAKECIETIHAAKKRRLSVDYKNANPDKNHSLQILDSESFKRIIEALEAYEINPDAIDIVYDEQNEAYAGIQVGSGKLYIHFTPIDDPKIKKASYFYQQYYGLHVPAHEVTHIIEFHAIQQQILLYYLMESGYDITFIKQQQSWKNWTRMQEKIADLMPLLLSKKIGSLEALLLLSFDSFLRKKMAITWNQSDPDDTHPDACAELLPYLLRIQELSVKKA